MGSAHTHTHTHTHNKIIAERLPKLCGRGCGLRVNEIHTDIADGHLVLVWMQPEVAG